MLSFIEVNPLIHPSSRRYIPGWALSSSTTSLHCCLSFIFSIHCFMFITFKSATTSLSNPTSKLLSSTFVSHLSEADRWVSEQIIFTAWSCQPHAQPPTWRTRVSLFVWVTTLDLSGMGGPTSSLHYHQHSSRLHVTTRAPPLRQSRDTFRGELTLWCQN